MRITCRLLVRSTPDIITVKKLLIAIARAALLLFVFGISFICLPMKLEAIQASSEDSHTSSTQLQSNSIFYGETKRLGNGTVRTFVKFSKNGTPSDIGVAFTEAALSGLPKENDHFGAEKFGEEFPLKLTLRDGIGFSTFEYELSFPPEATATPFTHMALNWNPKGHGEQGIFTKPHFDFHFCTINPKERHSITVDDDFLKRAYRQIPIELEAEGYKALPLAAEPRMGAHWIDITGPEFKGQPWTKSFLFGSFDGKIVFLEPMITKDFLETKTNTTDFIKQPKLYPKSSYYPTTYSIEHADGKYEVSLNGLTFRSFAHTYASKKN